MRRLSVVGLVGWLLVGSLGTTQAGPCAPSFAHVVVVIEENHGFDQVIGNVEAPFINGLARQGLLFSDAHGVAHPSQPNYLAWWSGSSQGVRDDVVSPARFDLPNFGTRLATLGQSVLAVEEPPVVGKHAPWVSFAHNGTLHRTAELSPPASLPALTFIVPNQRNDMHSGSLARGDAWLAQHLPAWTAKLGPQDLLILTFDEDNFTPANHIPLIWWGRSVAPGRFEGRVDHLNALRTVGDGLGIEPLTQAEPIVGALQCPDSIASL